jgi:hypothetical protein
MLGAATIRHDYLFFVLYDTPSVTPSPDGLQAKEAETLSCAVAGGFIRTLCAARHAAYHMHPGLKMGKTRRFSLP